MVVGVPGRWGTTSRLLTNTSGIRVLAPVPSWSPPAGTGGGVRRDRSTLLCGDQMPGGIRSGRHYINADTIWTALGGPTPVGPAVLLPGLLARPGVPPDRWRPPLPLTGGEVLHREGEGRRLAAYCLSGHRASTRPVRPGRDPNSRGWQLLPGGRDPTADAGAHRKMSMPSCPSSSPHRQLGPWPAPPGLGHRPEWPAIIPRSPGRAPGEVCGTAAVRPEQSALRRRGSADGTSRIGAWATSTFGSMPLQRGRWS